METLLQICDFGLAKWKQQAAAQKATGDPLAAFAFMAPEVLKDADVSRTTAYDVYGFGILLWELLSGRQPFEDGTYYVCYAYANTQSLKLLLLAVIHVNLSELVAALIFTVLCYT